MRKLSSAVLLVAGLLIGLGGYGHSFMGRLVLDKELAKFPLEVHVFMMLYVVWYFVGGCMLLFGVVSILAWWRAQRGESTLLLVTSLIGVLYLATGMGGLLYTHGQPFHWLFFTEGLLLLLASLSLRKHPAPVRVRTFG